MSSLRSCLCLVSRTQRLRVATLEYTGKRYIQRHVSATFIEISKRKKKLGPQPEAPRSSFLEWNYDAEIYAFNQRLKEKFDLNILVRALTHRSYVIQQEMKEKNVGIENSEIKMEDNRSLIETGRALTSKIIESYLSKALPRASEECILALHNHLMSTETLANSSSLIGTKDIILTEEFPPTPETLANTFFALVAALAESVDGVHAGKFVRDFLIVTLCERDLAEIWCPENPLELLNTILANEGREAAEPRIITQCGINTLVPVYQIALYSNKEYLSEGVENTIDDAVKVASLNALFSLFGILPTSNPMSPKITVDPLTDEMTNLPIHKWCTNNIDKLISKQTTV